MDETITTVDGSSTDDAVERQQRLGKNIVRLAIVLVIPYVLFALWALPVEALTVAFFASVLAFLVSIPRLIRKNKIRLLMLLLVPVVIAIIDLFPDIILGPAYVFLIIGIPIGVLLLIGMIVVYLSRRSKLGHRDAAVNDATPR